jgi:hypothetical protein
MQEGAAHRILDPVRDVERVFDPFQVGDQDREFVAAQARQVVLAARCARTRSPSRVSVSRRRATHGLRAGEQQVVADVVAERVVDALEGVQVHEQHRELLVADLRALQLAFQRFEEGLAVRDAGQAVAIGQAPDLFFGALALADVAHQAQHLVGSGGDQARLEVLGPPKRSSS